MAKANEKKKVEAAQAAEEHQGQIAEEAATETVETPTETVDEAEKENPVAKFLEKRVSLPKEFTHVNVRSKPNDKSKVVNLIPNGEAVNAKAVNDAWSELETGGFVKAEFLE